MEKIKTMEVENKRVMNLLTTIKDVDLDNEIGELQEYLGRLTELGLKRSKNFVTKSIELDALEELKKEESRSKEILELIDGLSCLPGVSVQVLSEEFCSNNLSDTKELRDFEGEIEDDMIDVLYKVTKYIYTYCSMDYMSILNNREGILNKQDFFYSYLGDFMVIFQYIPIGVVVYNKKIGS